MEQFLWPAIRGSGTKSFTEAHATMACSYQSHLFRTAFIDAVPQLLDYMQTQNLTSALLGGNVAWEKHNMSYTVSAYKQMNLPSNNKNISYGNHAQTKRYTGSYNRCDEALMYVVGGASLRMEIRRTAVSFDKVTYHFDIPFYDKFDFDGNYLKAEQNGFDTTFAKLIIQLGKLLKLDTYEWNSKTGFDITVPNTCNHRSSGNYRWELSGSDLVNITGEGLTANKLNKQTYVNTSNQKSYYYYKLDNMICLEAEAPWTIEINMKTSGAFALSPAETVALTPNPTFRKVSGELYTVYIDRQRGTSPSTGKETTLSHQDRYGINYKELGFKNSSVSTFLLENRVAANGSNMVWLSINGEEVGPLNHYKRYDAYSKETLDKGTSSSGYDGKDFYFAYLYNKSYAFTTSIAVNYIEIRSGCEPSDALVITGTATNCTTDGKTEGNHCARCGEILAAQETISATDHTLSGWTVHTAPACAASGEECRTCACGHYESREVAALGHTEVVDTGIAPNCTAEGKTEGKHCAVCNEVLTAQQVIPALGHAWDEGTITTEPSEAGDGIRTYTCASCGEAKAETIHRYTSTTTNATCTQDGYTTHTCPCGDSYTDNHIPAVGHNYGKPVFNWAEDLSSCTASFMCRNCDDVQIVEATVTTEQTPATKTEPEIIHHIATAEFEGETHSEIWGQPQDPETEGILGGDANGDSNVNTKDATRILRYYAELTPASEIDLIAADVNGDGNVNTKDATRVLRYYADLIDSLVPEK